MRNKRFIVSRGALNGEGPTRKDAKAHLEGLIDWALKDNGPHIESRFCFVIVIAATANGWQSTLLTPDDIAQHGKVKQCSMFSGQGEIKPLIQSSRNHAAQNAWTCDVDDEEHIAAAGLDRPEELRRWCKFQRDYLAAKAVGKTNNEAWEIAIGRPQ